MRYFTWILALAATLAGLSSDARADTGSLQVTVTYRERIALPPDAELDVQLSDVSRMDTAATRISSQRFALSGVPMSITLAYDPNVLDAQGRYVVVAEIWSEDRRMFRAASDPLVFGSAGTDPVDLVLTMMEDPDAAQSPAQSIAGVQWAVTEIAGDPWGNEDPATIIIDDQMTLAIFGGCNRFMGQVSISGHTISFPRDLAGTKMACPPEIDARERQFLEALSRAASFVRYRSWLVLTDAEGAPLLHFEERPE